MRDVRLSELPISVGQGRYEVSHKLGQGGLSVVLSATDRVLGVERALKMVLPERSRCPVAKARLVTEGRALARVRHPNVLAAFDLFEDEAVGHVLVLEVVKRGSVRDALGSGWRPLAAKQRRVMTSLLEALQAVHDLGLVHRDVKPGNCLLTSNGKVKLADFGGVGLADGAEASEFAMGTLRFCAPEQRVDAHRVDARADVFSSGATFLSLLGRRVPEKLPWIADKPEHSFWASVPSGPREVILKACRSRPAERYQSAEEMLGAVRDAF